MQPRLPLWGDLSLSTYFAMIALGLTLGTFVLRREALREGLRPRDVFDVALALIPGGAIGARLFVAFADPARFLADPLDVLWRGGFVVYGALVGGMGAVALTAWWKGLDPWRVADVFAPALPFGHAFARLGCLGAGCCHGRATTMPWGVRYAGGAVPDALHGVPLHPSPLYESLLALALFVGLTWLRTRQRYPGQAFLALLVAYGVGRATLELFRGDVGRGVWLGGMLSTGQITAMVLTGTALIVARTRRQACTPS